MTKVLCVIPARMASGRYPGKPLVPLLGLGLTLHVYDRCRLCAGIDRTVIATCDEEIRAAAVAHGAEVVMTRNDHPGCVDRTEEAVDKVGGDLVDDDLVLMVQGDEVLVGPDMLGSMLAAYEKSKPDVVNLASPILTDSDHDDPNLVKMVIARDGRAIFFSRAPVPSRSRKPDVEKWYQTGVIGFSRSFLRIFGKLPRTPLEMAEHIDMMRTIEHGYSIQAVPTEKVIIGVDTPADRDRAEDMLRADEWTAKYLSVPAK